MSGRVVAIVPARGGSKGIRGKNVAPLGGRPLIAHTIRAAEAARTIDRVVVSTDSDAIARAARAAGAEVPFRRPARLASDSATTEAVVRHALAELSRAGEHPDIVVVLQPTSPLRTAADIDSAVRLLRRTRAPSVVTVTRVDHPVEWLFRIDRRRKLTAVVRGSASARRQDTRPAYRLNGAIYAVRRDEFLRTGRLRTAESLAYEMPRERSIDIDEPMDLLMAEAFLRRRPSVSRARPRPANQRQHR